MTDRAQQSAADNRRRANALLIESLVALWEVVPDWRFGQLVMNLSRTDGGFADTWEWKNGDWRARIEALYYEYAGGNRV